MPLFNKKKPQYVLCPRCELNYFMPEKKQAYCAICLAELGEGDPSILIPDDDNIGETLCPVCKANFMLPGETMCFLCAKESDRLVESEDDSELSENWADIEYDDPDLDVIPLEMLEEEEAAEDDEYYAEESEEADDFDEEFSESFYDEADDDEEDDIDDEEDEEE